MGLSKSHRIMILLGIDSAFFLLELVVGYAVHSLALVADSFHMLNDVLSLCVGLWAVKVANEKTQSRRYTYGFQRAETLGALINGVFLVALCLSIFLEAIQRLVEPQEVSQPKLVLIVGCFGLASNILGLFLFHDHGHSHGPGGHDHSHGSTDQLGAAEEGHSHAAHEVHAVADEGGNIADILPQNRIGGWPQTSSMNRRSVDISEESSDRTQRPETSRSRHAHSRSRSRGFGDFPVHPASFRNEIINAARLESVESGSGSESETDENGGENTPPNETTSLLSKSKGNKTSDKKSQHHHDRTHSHDMHAGHRHNQKQDAGHEGGHGHGHSHGDLNMRGVFLHVMGDALGNVGVIASALVIWLTDFSWRFYSDPLISLIITVIILCSAIPLCKAASRILLQAAPAGIDVDDIEADIVELPGIISCHHLHVWQLSDTKLVASLHVQVEFDFKGQGSARYMELARTIRKCLHGYGIHSSTIQPEFCLNEEHDHVQGSGSSDADTCDGDNHPVGRQITKQASKTGSIRSKNEPEACLLECGGDCGNGNQCCPPSTDATRDPSPSNR